MSGRRHPIPPERQPIIEGPVARIPLTQGQVALVDLDDLDLIAGRLWAATKVRTECGFYAVWWGGAGRPRPNVEMHRLLMDHPAAFVDHVNGNGLDNRRANLRLCTPSENLRNRVARKPASASSPYLGVSIHSKTGLWQVSVRSGPGEPRVNIGRFTSEIDAAHARDDYIRTHCPSEFWTFNFPRPNERGIHLPQGATA